MRLSDAIRSSHPRIISFFPRHFPIKHRTQRSIKSDTARHLHNQSAVVGLRSPTIDPRMDGMDRLGQVDANCMQLDGDFFYCNLDQGGGTDDWSPWGMITGSPSVTQTWTIVKHDHITTWYLNCIGRQTRNR